jgi:hypothetical protein
LQKANSQPAVGGRVLQKAKSNPSVDVDAFSNGKNARVTVAASDA